MTQAEINAAVAAHEKYLKGDIDNGIMANLTGADLRGANLNCTDLTGANLIDADLRGADLTGANLRDANLRGANLNGANFYGANLTGAALTGADLIDIKINHKTCGIALACPEEGAFIGYKKAQKDKIVVLEIPADAKRSSATTAKCRCDKAKVLRIENFDGTIAKETTAFSCYDPMFLYTVGKTVTAPDFDEDRWNECSKGIHFFINKENAKNF